jgi:hypothetical protein
MNTLGICRLLSMIKFISIILQENPGHDVTVRVDVPICLILENHTIKLTQKKQRGVYINVYTNKVLPFVNRNAEVRI